MTNIWCICSLDIDTLEIFEGPDVLKEASIVIGHNFIDYDFRVLNRFFPGTIPRSIVYDTLVLSRLLKYQLDDGEGHSLEAWGNRLGFPKDTYAVFDKFTPELLERCKQDVQITYHLYRYLQQFMSDLSWTKAIAVEHEMAHVCLQMREDGFSYDMSRAQELKESLRSRLQLLDTEISKNFPPKARAIREITPRLTKHGTISKANLPRDWSDLTVLDAGCPFTYITWEEFNPGSPSQIVERLNAFGWKPTIPTKSGKSFKICEENLATLPETAPKAARSLVERLLVASRVRTLEEWEACYRPSTGRIHGTVKHIGTWTGRMSHVKPNLGNVAAPKSIKYKGRDLAKLATDLGGRMRSLWTASPGWWLVGTDAESIQLRILAHYIDDPIFTEALVNGKKDELSDPHSLNSKILGCDRDTAKTFIYAFLLGAGDRKIGEILGVNERVGRQRKRAFIEAYPGLASLKETTIPGDAKRGYFEGLDGRRIYCNDEHLMLAAYLQNGEAAVMKHANILWRKELDDLGIRYKQVNFCHDEWVTEVDGTREEAETAGTKQAEAIGVVAERLQVRCPMSGSFRVGRTWFEVH